MAGQIAEGYSPKLEFEPACRIVGDIAPAWGDCTVDNLDLRELCAHWLDTPAELDWNRDADLAPVSAPDERINFLDYAVLALHWLESTGP